MNFLLDFILNIIKILILILFIYINNKFVEFKVFAVQYENKLALTTAVENKIHIRPVCLGTDNSRNTIIVENSVNHYNRLKNLYKGCQKIVGNLEITHIEENDWINNTLTQNFNSTSKFSSLQLFNPFQFLENLEEITGYLLIFNLQVESLTFPRLKFIWGIKQLDGDALQITHSKIRYLNLPELRSIENGNVTIMFTKNLCYMNPDMNLFDYSQILGKNYKSKVKTDLHRFESCDNIKPCDSSCNRACFGPNSNQCQIVYRRNCKNCASDSCFIDLNGTSHCCDEDCAGGCYGNGNDKCIACKHYKQDGKCVRDCRGIFQYNQNLYTKIELTSKDRRYYYGNTCVQECPAGKLIEDRYCVAHCSPGFYRNLNIDERVCIPCNGICPKICKLNEILNSENIRNLINCSEIEGNLEILSHVFTSHPPIFTNISYEKITLKSITPLTALDLEVLKSVRIITGYIMIDGGKQNNSNMPTSLSFLENLEIIEGRKVYAEKYSLYIIGNLKMKWLGLKSLKKIGNGFATFTRNPFLCYSYTIPFSKIFKIKKSSWTFNMKPDECESLGHICDSSCNLTEGCWGSGSEMCVRCLKYNLYGKCAEKCPINGYFVSKDNPRECFRCHSQCYECYGTKSTECNKCRNFEYWTKKVSIKDNENDNNNNNGKISNINSKAFTYLPEKILQCVANCPIFTYPTKQKICESCNEACYEYGCTGPSEFFGEGGCNQCQYGITDKKSGKIKCLTGENELTVCKSNKISSNYYIHVGPMNISKYMCLECREECKKCTRESIIEPECECAMYKLISDQHEYQNTTMCVKECGKGSFLYKNFTHNTNNNKAKIYKPGVCKRCHKFCDARYSCSGILPTDCDQCEASIINSNNKKECLDKCPLENPYSYEGFCHAEDKNQINQRRRNTIIWALFTAAILFILIVGYLSYRCLKYRKKYEKEAQMHLPEIPALDPRKITQRPNMRRLNLIAVDELDDSKKNILGSGAFGIVYAGKWKPPSRPGISIPVAVKAINPFESRHTTEAEMMKEAGLMASIQHEHLLPLVGISVAKGGIKIVTILRPLGSLLKFLNIHNNRLGSKNLILYCYQISSAMEFLTKKKIVHRDLAARNVLVKNINHVEVTDFGLAQMLQGTDTEVIVEGRVAVKWLAIESLRQQIYTERTDVWSFGVTCWEISTFGQSPYRELSLPRDQRLARELAIQLEKGYRLKQPVNCSQELYQEMLNCWLIDSESRPTFRQLKEKFQLFCRAPHIYIQDKHITQRMDSITSNDQRQIIERLLQDSDFLDPVNIDPAEYSINSTNENNNLNTSGNFFSTNTMETTLPPASPCTLTRPLMWSEQTHQSSTGTINSSRYKTDPILRKNFLSISDKSIALQNSEIELNNEENYLKPKNNQNMHSLVNKPLHEDNKNEEKINNFSTNQPVNENDYFPTYLNEIETSTINYANDKSNENNNLNDLLLSADQQIKNKIKYNNGKLVSYVNVQQHETSI